MVVRHLWVDKKVVGGDGGLYRGPFGGTQCTGGLLALLCLIFTARMSSPAYVAALFELVSLSKIHCNRMLVTLFSFLIVVGMCTTKIMNTAFDVNRLSLSRIGASRKPKTSTACCFTSMF